MRFDMAEPPIDPDERRFSNKSHVLIRLLLVFCIAAALSPISACTPGSGSPPLTANGIHAGSSKASPSFGEWEPRRGYVNVICLEGDGEDMSRPDTLFSCLLRARETGLGTVDLPQGVYIGHVAEFIVKSLDFYDLEHHFEVFHGYRIVLRFREADAEELSSRRYTSYTYFALGSAAGLALNATTGLVVPAMAVGFFFESAKAENRRVQLKEQAGDKSLPGPNRSTLAVAWDNYTDELAFLWRNFVNLFSNDSEPQNPEVRDKYIVEECYIAVPSTAEIIELAKKQTRE
jgi:hypothetical protein